MSGTISKLFMLFGEEAWEDVKESSCTQPFIKMSGMLLQAESKGHRAERKVAQSWCNGISPAKVFCAKHREFNKAKGRHNRFEDLFPHLLGGTVRLHRRTDEH